MPCPAYFQHPAEQGAQQEHVAAEVEPHQKDDEGGQRAVQHGVAGGQADEPREQKRACHQ